jgi:hypothetical protein
MAFWLLVRFTPILEGGLGDKIDLTSPNLWYQKKAFPHQIGDQNIVYDENNAVIKVQEKEMSYSTQYSSLNNLLNTAKISSTAKTHLGRHSAVHESQKNGADSQSLHRLGMWRMGMMSNHYQNEVPFRALRANAGFSPDEQSYVLPRADIFVPENVQQAFFSHLNLDKIGSFIPTDSTTRGFFDLLKFCRVVLAQDSRVLRKEDPENPLWKMPVFQNEHYKAWIDSFPDQDSSSTASAEFGQVLTAASKTSDSRNLQAHILEALNLQFKRIQELESSIKV